MPQKSGILDWNEENIKNTPEGAGVFVLTNSPINGSVTDLKCVENLRSNLEEFSRSDLEKPKFFYWYSTTNLEEAQVLFEKLRLHYGR